MYIRIILFLILLLPFDSYAAINGVIQYRFRHLTFDNGLSHADANVVVQDKRGFIWIGTYSGLNRYDGYEIRSYYNELSYINKPYLNRIHDICVSDEGLLWLATSAGIQVFDPYKEEFIPIQVRNEIHSGEEYESEKIISVGTAYILVKNNDDRIVMYKVEDSYTLTREPFHIDARCFSFYKDNKQRVWVGSENGLYVLQKDNTWSHLRLPDENGKNVAIRFSLVDRDNCLLVATERNLYLFNRNVEEMFKTADNVLTDGLLLPVDLSGGWVTDLLQDVKGDYWVSSLKGLYHVFKDKEEFVVNTIFTGNYPTSLTSDFISRLLLDSSGNLFVSTYGGGVNILDMHQNPFFFIQKKPFETNTLSENIVRAISESDGCLWLGTNSAGLNCLDRKEGKFTYYNTHSPTPFRLVSNGLRALLNDSEGTLWVGHTEGIDLINLQTKTIKNVPEIVQAPLGEITSLVKDCFKQIWVGTWSNGIARIRKKENGSYETVLFKVTKPDYPAFTPSRIITIYADSIRPEILYSSGKQLIRLFLDQHGDVEKSLIYQASDAKVNSLSSNFVCSIARESDTILWIGCIGGGLNRMHLLPNGDYQSEVFSSLNGLNQKDVESLLMDDAGNLWLGANGLTEYVPEDKKFNYYRTVDGNSVNSFKVGGAYRGQDGRFYFGGIKGVVYFNPAEIKKNKLNAKPEIASVLVNNHRLRNAGEYELPYDRNNFTLCFTGLHYASPEQCRFRYRLTPFEKEWRISENGNNSVNYANLPYGDYRFELSASNNDGVWGPDVCYLPILITPPWWLSWYAKVVYAILVLSLLYAVYFYLLRWLTMKKQLEIKHLKEQQSERIHQMQLQFFTNISHEFRTPLTLMLGTIEKIALSHSWKLSYEDILMRNVKRLMNLVDELIDFRKVETDDFKLSVREQDIHMFIEKIVTDFNLLAATKNIRFRVNIPDTIRLVWFDPEIMEKIVLNLLNNAFKYTKEGGSVEVTVDEPLSAPVFEQQYIIESGADAEEHFCLYMRDSGVGISKESIEKIFTRYYRIQDSDYDPHLGSGVGLALVKSFLLLHRGNLVVSSERGKGTDFLLTFPCSRKDYKEEDISCDGGIILPNTKLLKYETHTNSSEKNEVTDLSSATILLVEDNDEVRNFLSESLRDTYVIWQATDGQDALSVMRQQIPDIIISDLMMPNIDGNELCRIVKNENDFPYIPFIMLTAKASLEARIEGTDAGADAYLAKPVSLKLLTSVIRNLLLQKRRVKEMVSSTYLQDTYDETIQAKDKEFYDAFLQVLISELSNPELDVNLIAHKMGYSRTRLYQKVKEITDKPVMELVRQLRLKKAVQVMAEEDLPISEIILRIGIQSQSYFTNTFKKEYGNTPGQYMKKLKNKNPNEIEKKG